MESKFQCKYIKVGNKHLVSNLCPLPARAMLEQLDAVAVSVSEDPEDEASFAVRLVAA